MMRKLLLLLFITFLPVMASADDVQIDGIWYSLSSSNGVNTACVKDVPNDCSGDIVIPESITYEEVTYSVTSIENYAFDYCSSLTSVTIPNSVTSIGYGVFRDCSSLTSMNVVEGNTKYDSRENCNAIIETSSNSLIAGCKNSTIPNSVTSIGDSAFEFCSGLTSITIPEGVTSIENSAFRCCSGLTSITIPGSVTSIGSSTFYGCNVLTSITILNGVTRIDGRAFEFCSGLTSITIPESVRRIDYHAFSGCSSLTSVTCLASNPPWCFYSFGGEGEITLYVPVGCKEKYAAKEPWNQFKEIIEIGAETKPDITLSGQEENGLVRLLFDAVPNDLRYRIIRSDGNGVKVKVDSKEGSSYPARIEFVDEPSAAGTYTYFVEMPYLDSEGQMQGLQSNEVTITIAAPQTEEEGATYRYGYIVGRIECDKNPPISGLKVKFSDDVTVSAHGTNFMRQKIKEGESLTMTVLGDDSHDYETVSVNSVTIGKNLVTIKGKAREDYQPNANEFDLAYCQNLKVVTENGESHAKFSVKNYGDYPWEGTVIIEAKQKVNNFTKWFLKEKPVYRGTAKIKELAAEKAYVDLDIVIEGLELDEDTEFLFDFKSNGRWKREGNVEDIVEKRLTFDTDQLEYYHKFPIEAKVPKNIQGAEKWNGDAQEEFGYLMLGISSVTPGMDGMVGDMTPYKEKVLSVTKAKDALKVIMEWLEGKTVMEAINDPNFLNITSAIKGVLDDLKSSYSSTFSQKYWKRIVGQVADVADAELMLNGIKELNTMISEDTNTSDGAFKFSLSCASMIYQLASLGNTVPLTQMMNSYLVVGESLVNAAKRFGPITNSRYILGRLKANKPYTGDEKDRVNTTTDFKLVINRVTSILSRTVPIDFTDKDVQRQIKSISIKAAYNEQQTPAEFSFIPVYKKDCIMLKSDGKGITGGSYLDENNEISVLYMEINWKNGRQTLIPLQQASAGVSFNDNNTTIVTDHYEDYKPLDYTVTLTTTTGKDNIADELYLGPKK